MAPSIKQHLSGMLTMGAVLMWVLSSCTDKRTPLPPVLPPQNQFLAPAQTLVAVVDLRYQDKITQVYQMLITPDHSMHLTGKPFIYMKWDMGSNPENPQKYFALSENIDRLFGAFVVDWYAKGALAVIGNWTLLSGDVGATVIDTSETLRPREAYRYPPFDPNAMQTTRDEAFLWTAIAPHPQLPLFQAFRQSDYGLTVGVSGGQLNLVSKNYYLGPGQTVCCVDRTTVFDGKVFVAWRSKLVYYEYRTDGSLGTARQFGAISAVNVTSSDDLLYVQHQNNFANPTALSYPDGIYVFDRLGRNIGFLQPDHPIKVFAVSRDNTHLYANIDDTAVRVYRIVWGTRSGAPPVSE